VQLGNSRPSSQAKASKPNAPGPRGQSDPYRAVVRSLVGCSGVGSALVGLVGFALDNPVVVDAALALALATGILLALARRDVRRIRGDAGALAKVQASKAKGAPRRRASLNPSRAAPLWSFERFERRQGVLAALGGLADAALLVSRWDPTPDLPIVGSVYNPTLCAGVARRVGWGGRAPRRTALPATLRPLGTRPSDVCTGGFATTAGLRSSDSVALAEAPV
jgi:hypothetical protein